MISSGAEWAPRVSVSVITTLSRAPLNEKGLPVVVRHLGPR